LTKFALVFALDASEIASKAGRVIFMQFQLTWWKKLVMFW